MMKNLEQEIAKPEFVSKKFEKEGKAFVVKAADNFEYVDPIDKSISKNQVLNISSIKAKMKEFSSLCGRRHSQDHEFFYHRKEKIMHDL